MTVTMVGRSLALNVIREGCLNIPLFGQAVAAGFPSPAQDFIDKKLDLNELCIKHPSATFFVRVEGDSMLEAGIYPKDILVIDRSITPIHGDIIIASLQGELTVKELATKPYLCLLPRNAKYQPIVISEEAQFEIFGVVTGVVRQVRRNGI